VRSSTCSFFFYRSVVPCEEGEQLKQVRLGFKAHVSVGAVFLLPPPVAGEAVCGGVARQRQRRHFEHEVLDQARSDGKRVFDQVRLVGEEGAGRDAVAHRNGEFVVRVHLAIEREREREREREKREIEKKR